MYILEITKEQMTLNDSVTIDAKTDCLVDTVDDIVSIPAHSIDYPLTDATDGLINEDKVISTLSNDPSTYCMIVNLPPAMIEFLINKGPMQPTKQDLPLNKFPINNKNRSFQTS